MTDTETGRKAINAVDQAEQTNDRVTFIDNTAHYHAEEISRWAFDHDCWHPLLFAQCKLQVLRAINIIL